MPHRFLLSVVAAVALALAGCSSDQEPSESAPIVGEKLNPDPVALQQASAMAMGEVESARFTLERSGAPVFIDGADVISLDSLEGVFAAPASAEARLMVTVSGSLRTELGAVAIDDEIWLSNPITGKFETLPPAFDIDPSSFFDPKGAWQPLLESLEAVEFVGEEDREGPRYHLTAIAPEARIRAVTADLVRGSDVSIDLWIHPVTALVHSLEFDTELDGAANSWVLELGQYGESFEITEPTKES